MKRKNTARWTTIGISLAIHALLPVGLLILPGGILRKHEPKPIDIVFYREAAPEPEPIPLPEPKPEPEPEPAPIEIAEVEPPPPVAPRPKPRVEPPPPRVAAAPPPEKLKPAVRTDLFAAEPEPEPEKPRAERRVARSAGFAEVETTAREPEARERVVANGRFSDGAMTVTREAKPPRTETVTDTSFDIASAEAVPRPAPRKVSSTVTQGGFGDGVREARPRRREQDDESLDSQVEIVSKPRPLYTEEARRMRVEGEVVLEVTFVASGEIRVHGVVAGLGHGLDEAAMAAAEKIEFKPARKNGQPVDYRATLRVLFRLA